MIRSHGGAKKGEKRAIGIVILWLGVFGVLNAPRASWAANQAIPVSVDIIGDRQTVIATLRGEAQGEGLAGMVAVAEVLRNRAVARGTTMSEEALRPKQFSFWNNKKAAYTWLMRHWGLGLEEMALDALDQSIGGSDSVRGATSYYNPKLASPGWARKMRETAIIGNHRFMKEVI